MLLPHLASRLYGTPLLIARSKLEVILSVLGERIGWPELTAGLPAYPVPRSQSTSAPGIAVIPVHGTLVRRALGVEAASGMSSYGEIAATIDAAVADPAITGILLDVDSPGGEAGGVFELGQRIRAANALKPVWAVANDSAFSAAYAIACSASRVFVTGTAGVGSIGVIAMHVDQTVRDAKDGYRYTAITAGARKNDFSPHEVLTSDAHAGLQAEVSRLYDLFVAHVAQMRGIAPALIRDTEAGLFFGPAAVASGLADAQGSLESALLEFNTFISARDSPRLLAQRSPRSESRSLPRSTPRSTPRSITQKEIFSMSAPNQDAALAASDAAQSEVLPDPDLALALDAARTEAGAAAHATAHAQALAVAELCQLAGHPERTATFLAEGSSEAEVRRTLLAARATSVEIASLIAPDAAASRSTQALANPLMAAVNKRNHQEI
jgi:signal peptide peptidase SppA